MSCCSFIELLWSEACILSAYIKVLSILSALQGVEHLEGVPSRC